VWGAFYLPDAQASGLFFSDRGVRPLSRGGAFVAGADDASAIWYNPAGLVEARSSLLVDFSVLNYSSRITRETLVADTNGAQRIYGSPPVTGSAQPLPVPTIAGSYVLDSEGRWVGALGVFAPYTPIATFPETIDGLPAPTRYALRSLEGSALAIAGGWISVKLSEQLRVGIGAEALVGTFQSLETLSASPPGRFLSASEDPAYDTTSLLKVSPIFAPSANMGMIYLPHPRVRLGISGQLPFSIDAPATIQVRLPDAPEFDQASQEGNKARVKFKLPGILRAGIEVRPWSTFRAEVSYVRELWSSHRSIDITPTNIQLINVTGFPSPYKVAPISIPRNFKDTNSIRLGAEYSFHLLGYHFDCRAGGSFEQGAIPRAYLSSLTVDMDKFNLALGGSWYPNSRWRIDFLYSHVFGRDTFVDPRQAAVPRINPVRGNPTDSEAINGGSYRARADILGVGAAYSF
jgi:long-chain fatty acid transport protein